MTSISKNVYIDKIDGKYNNTYHRTIKTKPVHVKSNTYVDSRKEINDEDPEFKIGDIVRISKYKNISAKGYVPNWSEEVFVIKKFKNTVPWACVICDLEGEKLLERFTKTNCEKQVKKSLELKK